MVSSLCNYLSLRIHCNETVSVFMHAIQKPTTEKILERVTDQQTHATMHDVISTIHVTQVDNHIPMVRNTDLS